MRTHDLIVHAWRVASDHNEIGPAVEAIAALLAEEAPLERLTVYRLDANHGIFARLASTASSLGPSSAALPPIVSSPEQIRRIEAWVRGGASVLANHPRELPKPLALLAREQPQGSLWVAPLVRGDSLGLAVAGSVEGRGFSARHEQLLAATQEPLGVALANDLRWHEMAALREAAEADNRSLLRRLGRTDLTERVVGERTGLAPVMRRVDLVSGSDAPVLLLGETGTGKEVIARTIHQRSKRHDGPFIRVNCGAIPPDLIDSQLFGHEKGAFTGASEQRKGWFERADGGTLFLDEIGELPADAQVRFLRVLQDSLVERVGGGDAIHVEVRVIAATHRDLPAMAQAGAFREDLWYRIAVFPILLPPLRERSEDIPELAEHFAQRAAARFGLTPVTPKADDLRALRAYHWPGNIRELGAVIDRAAILGEGLTLEISSALGFAAPPATISSSASDDPSCESLATLDEVAKRHIESTLRRTRGKVEGADGAAKLLGINPHTLRARMRKLGVSWAEYRR